MIIEPLGQLERDPSIETWLVSGEVPVPYAGGERLRFTVEDVEEDEAPQDFEEAIRAFLALSEDDRPRDATHVFQEYERAGVVWDEASGDEATIASPEDVWRHVRWTEVHVRRRTRGDGAVYVQLAGECGWDPEHGLQLVFRGGAALSRVSDQDGHLTTADAFALPEEQDAIVYRAPEPEERPPLRGLAYVLDVLHAVYVITLSLVGLVGRAMADKLARKLAGGRGRDA